MDEGIIGAITGLAAVAILVVLIVSFMGSFIQINQDTVLATGVSPSQLLFTKDLNVGETIRDNSDGNYACAQTFLAGYNTIDSIDLNLSKGSTAVSNKDLNVSIRSTSGVRPTTTLTTTTVSGSLLGTVGRVINVPIETSGLTVGTRYAIVVDYNVAGSDTEPVDLNFYKFSVRTGNPYTDGNLWCNKEGGNWYEIDGNGSDMYFGIHYADHQPLQGSGTLNLLQIMVLVVVASLIVVVVRSAISAEA